MSPRRSKTIHDPSGLASRLIHVPSVVSNRTVSALPWVPSTSQRVVSRAGRFWAARVVATNRTAASGTNKRRIGVSGGVDRWRSIHYIGRGGSPAPLFPEDVLKVVDRRLRGAGAAQRRGGRAGGRRRARVSTPTGPPSPRRTPRGEV